MEVEPPKQMELKLAFVPTSGSALTFTVTVAVLVHRFELVAVTV